MKLSAQAIFNTSLWGLYRQDWAQSITDEEGCVYNDGEGLKCAAGHLFTKEQMFHVGENIDFPHQHHKCFDDLHEHDELILRLQTFHDNELLSGYNLRSYECISGIAKGFSLHIPFFVPVIK